MGGGWWVLNRSHFNRIEAMGDLIRDRGGRNGEDVDDGNSGIEMEIAELSERTQFARVA